MPPAEAAVKTWQQTKSERTRTAILDAAIACLYQSGYFNTTKESIPRDPGVSRGAMLHHFPSKTELIQAAVEYLHNKLLEDYTARITAIPARLKGKARRRAGIDALWDHLTGDLFTVYHELLVASRTDPELERILASSQKLFEQHVRETNQTLFTEWRDRGDRFLLAMDLTKFLMEGLATSRLMTNRTARVKRLTDYLADRLEEIFEEGESSAVGRHTGRS